jgi:hypothetical protein
MTQTNFICQVIDSFENISNTKHNNLEKHPNAVTHPKLNSNYNESNNIIESFLSVGALDDTLRAADRAADLARGAARAGDAGAGAAGSIGRAAGDFGDAAGNLRAAGRRADDVDARGFKPGEPHPAEIKPPDRPATDLELTNARNATDARPGVNQADTAFHSSPEGITKGIDDIARQGAGAADGGMTLARRARELAGSAGEAAWNFSKNNPWLTRAGIGAAGVAIYAAATGQSFNQALASLTRMTLNEIRNLLKEITNLAKDVINTVVVPVSGDILSIGADLVKNILGPHWMAILIGVGVLFLFFLLK